MQRYYWVAGEGAGEGTRKATHKEGPRHKQPVQRASGAACELADGAREGKERIPLTVRRVLNSRGPLEGFEPGSDMPSQYGKWIRSGQGDCWTRLGGGS